MKKSVLIALFGAATVASYGQGFVVFQNYYSSHQATGITYANGSPGGIAGLGVGNEISVELFYGASTDTLTSQLTGIAGSIVAVGVNGATTPAALGTQGGYTGTGVFQGAGNGNVLVPSGTFNSIAYGPGSTYAFALYAFGSFGGNSYTGWSVIANGATQGTGSPLPTIPTLPNALYQGSFTVSEVAPVPEPSSLALAGLGGFGMLMAFRRKKA
jgi:hypothetical protein